VISGPIMKYYFLKEQRYQFSLTNLITTNK
jgi:hypothetical protein